MRDCLKIGLLSIMIIFYASSAFSQMKEDSLVFQNTIEIKPGDSKDVIIEKAASVVPDKNQLSALEREFIAFVHFGPNTFTRREWGTGEEDPKVFALTELHTDQWCKAMKAAGMKLVILTVKHHDGFVLWQSRYTRHGIMSTDFKGGKGDILRDLANSCRKYGLELGIYLSPADLFQIESPDGLYGNDSKYTVRTIPRDVPGRPFVNKTHFKFLVDDYNEYFLNQLFELLTEYGPIHEVWFDGANPKPKGNQKYNYLAWKKLIHKLAPGAVIFGKEDIRWGGNEAGSTRETEWNVIPYDFNPDTANKFPDMTSADLGSRDQLYKAKYLHYQPAEINTSIRDGWFYRDDQFQKVRSANDVYDIYERTVGGNAVFLLNIPPNRQGEFSPRDVAVLRNVGEKINETYSKNLFAGASGLDELLDDNLDTYVSLKKMNDEIVVKLDHPITINRFLIQEAVESHGERVEEHAVDAFFNGQWNEVASSTNIGFKRILRFPAVTSSEFRLRIKKYRAEPAIAAIGGYFYRTPPPDLQIYRDKNGLISINPKEPQFNWNRKKESAAADFYSGMRIYYTTDGKTPNENSKRYTEPFEFGKGQIRAIAFIDGATGQISSTTPGIPKSEWKIIGFDSEIRGHSAEKVMDSDSETYWQTLDTTEDHFISIDLGKVYDLSGFSYTPQNHKNEGMLEEGILEASLDGETWKLIDTFEFGNIVNDPTPRKLLFKLSVKARYVKIISKKIASGDKSFAVAELDFFE